MEKKRTGRGVLDLGFFHIYRVVGSAGQEKGISLRLFDGRQGLCWTLGLGVGFKGTR